MKYYCCSLMNDFGQIDPFLRLVDDRKLQALDQKIVEGDMVKIYGSAEDNEAALKTLSMINIGEDQSPEFYASRILKANEKLSDVISLPRWILKHMCRLVISALSKICDFCAG